MQQIDLVSLPESIHEADLKCAEIEAQIADLKAKMDPIKNEIEQEVYIISKLYTNDKARAAAVKAQLLADEDYGRYQDELTLAEQHLAVLSADLRLLNNRLAVGLIMAKLECARLSWLSPKDGQ